MPAYNRQGSCCCGGGIGPAHDCSTYQVRVLDTLGNPVAGLPVTMQLRAGTPSAPVFTPTYPDVIGSTDGSGVMTYAALATPPYNYVRNVIVGFPVGPTTVQNPQTSRIGDVCTFSYTLCTRTRVTTIMPGARVTSGIFWGVGCTTPDFPYIVYAGGTVTQKGFTLSALGTTGATIASANYGATSGGTFSGISGCLGGYWGGCLPAVAVPCETSVSDEILFWSQADVLHNPDKLCANANTDVIQKGMCVQFQGDNPFTGEAYSLAWDATTWDGRPDDLLPGMNVGPNARMIFRGGSGFITVTFTIDGPGSVNGYLRTVMGVTISDTTPGATRGYSTTSGANNQWLNESGSAGAPMVGGYVLNNDGHRVVISDGECPAAPPGGEILNEDGSGSCLLTEDGGEIRQESAPALRAAPPVPVARRRARSTIVTPTPTARQAVDLSIERSIIHCPHRGKATNGCSSCATCALGKGERGLVRWDVCWACQESQPR